MGTFAASPLRRMNDYRGVTGRHNWEGPRNWGPPEAFLAAKPSPASPAGLHFRCLPELVAAREAKLTSLPPGEPVVGQKLPDFPESPGGRVPPLPPRDEFLTRMRGLVATATATNISLSEEGPAP